MFKTFHITDHVEAKGRNGYFRAAQAVVFKLADGEVHVDIRSKRKGQASPIVIHGQAAMLRRLFVTLANYIEEDRAFTGQIARILSGSEWNADTLDQIADVVRAAGYTINEPGEED